MVTGFGAVILVTHDADRMAEFYRRALGIQLEPRLHDSAAILHYAGDLGGTTFSIHPVDNWRESPETGPGGTRLVFNTDDLDGRVSLLREREIRFKGPIDLASGRMVFLRDPDGNLIDLMERA